MAIGHGSTTAAAVRIGGKRSSGSESSGAASAKGGAVSLLFFLALLTAGCATQYMSYPPRPAAPGSQVNLSGYSEAFRQGYSDGCASSGGAFQRDEQRYRNDADYRMGWDDGNSICRRR